MRSVSPEMPIEPLQCRQKCALEQKIGGDRVLIIGEQVLLHRTEIRLQRLVAVEEIGFDELCVDIVSRASLYGTAALHPNRKVKLLGVAEQIAVRPARRQTGAEIGRISGAETDNMRWSFDHVELDRDTAHGIQFIRGRRPYRRKDPNRCEIRSRLLDRLRAELFTGMDQQTLVNKALVDGAQPLYRNLAEIEPVHVAAYMRPI